MTNASQSNALHGITAAVAETLDESVPEVVRWQLPKPTPHSRAKNSPVIAETTADEAVLVADLNGVTPRQHQPLQQVSHPTSRARSSELPLWPRVAASRANTCDGKDTPAATDPSLGFRANRELERDLERDQGSDTHDKIEIGFMHRCSGSEEGCGGSRGSGGEESSCTGQNNQEGAKTCSVHHSIDSAEGDDAGKQTADPCITLGLEG